MEQGENFNLKIKEHYDLNRSIFKITREFKIGKKVARQILIDQGVEPKKLIKGSYNKGQINIGDKFCRWTVIGESVNEQDRYLIPCQCECGEFGLVRESFLLSGKSLGCRKCINKVNYPTFRKSRNNPDINLKGLSPSWISSICNNLKRGIYRTLTSEINSFDLLAQLEKQNFKCAYTGEELYVLGLSMNKSNASIDRIDSSKNYTIDNIQWVLKSVNRMKNIYSDEEFLNTCFKIYRHRYGNPEPSSLNIN